MAELIVRVCPSLVAVGQAEAPAHDDARVLVLPLCQPSIEAGVGPPELGLGADVSAESTCGAVDVAGCLRCAESLLPHDLIERLGPDALPITHAWLARWVAAGAPAVRAARDTCTPHLVLLDTTATHEPLLERLADATGWPACAVPASTDYLRLRIEGALDSWRLAQLSDALRKARASATAHVLALEVFGQLAARTREDEVVEGLRQLFALLFGARTLRYTPAAPPSHSLLEHAREAHHPGEPVWATWEDAAAWAETNNGFRLRLDLAGRLLGVFDIGDFATPQARADYINLALTIAPAAGMALANARAMHGIIPICSYCKKIRDGRGDWWGLESYLTDHSDARFSHGICPNCVRDQLAAAGLDPDEEGGVPR